MSELPCWKWKWKWKSVHSSVDSCPIKYCLKNVVIRASRCDYSTNCPSIKYHSAGKQDLPNKYRTQRWILFEVYNTKCSAIFPQEFASDCCSIERVNSHCWDVIWAAIHSNGTVLDGPMAIHGEKYNIQQPSRLSLTRNARLLKEITSRKVYCSCATKRISYIFESSRRHSHSTAEADQSTLVASTCIIHHSGHGTSRSEGGEFVFPSLSSVSHLQCHCC